MKTSQLQFSLIIPAYNEQQLIRSNLNTLLNFLEENYSSFEILVVDDGSLDQTAKLVADFAQNHLQVKLIDQPVNLGKGQAIQRGVKESKGKYIIFMDADLPYELNALFAFLDALKEGADLAIGSRHLEGSLIKDVPPLRYFIGQVFSLLVSLLISPGIRDTQCGFKGFKAEVAQRIFQRTTIGRWGMDVEVLFIARKFNYSISQIPVIMTGFRNDSRVHVVKDSIRMFFDLFRIRWNDIRGIYN
ncbi:dolichyl-phosphate beta-glucosyltransferase [Chloroflexota bacterium]